MGRDVSISGSWIQTHRDRDSRTARPYLASHLFLSHSTIQPSQRVSVGKVTGCLIILPQLLPPPRTHFPTFSIFQIGTNSFAPFKTLLGGGNLQLPSGTPSFLVTLPHLTLHLLLLGSHLWVCPLLKP